jgi:hypothetical protein
MMHACADNFDANIKFIQDVSTGKQSQTKNPITFTQTEFHEEKQIMALSFLTKPQQMTFVDHNTHHVVNPWQLVAGATYDVFFTIQNDNSEWEIPATSYTVKVTHSAFGIGSLNGTSFLHQPVPVDVPPAGPGGNGLATLEFQFDATEAGHCCLIAQINSPNGACLNQNLTVYDGSVSLGNPTKLPFYVYWDLSTIVNLTLTEYKVDTSGHQQTITASESWNPSYVIPHPPTSTVNPTSALKIQLVRDHAPNPTLCYISITPKVLPAGIIGHIFNIVGTDNAAHYIGEAAIRVDHPVAGPVMPPAPYINGGYQSVDIKLYNANGTEVPLGGIPGAAQWDTLLQPDTDYRFAAVVHNASITDAVNTMVRFWTYQGGLGNYGEFLDVQTVTIPHSGSFEVFSSHPFHSAPAGQHKCAIVSIFNSMSGMCSVDATDFSQIPNPGNTGDPRCSAWRNTDSMFVVPNLPWHFNLAVYQKDWGPGPVEIDIQTHHAPVEWNKQADVVKTETILKSVGMPGTTPLYMLHSLRETMKPINVKAALKAKDGVKIEAGKAENKFLVHPIKESPAQFEVHGELPKDAKDGDVVLVNVIANYPKTEHTPATSVEFLEVLHVTNKRRQ